MIGIKRLPAIVLCGWVWLPAILWWAHPAHGHPPPGQPPGAKIGVFALTYYWVAEEKNSGQWPLYSPGCRKVIAATSREFHHGISREGTGRLADGRLLNFAERCGCARPGHAGRRACYHVLEKGSFPWGRGARFGGRYLPLQPFWSVAVDPRKIPVGTLLFIPLWRGRRAPDGRIMDGCFRAEDTGAAIRGRKLDFFAGTPQWARWLNRTYRYSRVTVYRGGPRCRGATP